MALSTLLVTIETDLRNGWADLEVEVESVSETVLETCWAGIKPVLTSIGPVILADAVSLAQAAVAELGSGAAVGEVLTHMLNAAENLGKQAIMTIESNLLGAVASIHLSAAIAANPPARVDAAARTSIAASNTATSTDLLGDAPDPVPTSTGPSAPLGGEVEPPLA